MRLSAIKINLMILGPSISQLIKSLALEWHFPVACPSCNLSRLSYDRIVFFRNYGNLEIQKDQKVINRPGVAGLLKVTPLPPAVA